MSFGNAPRLPPTGPFQELDTTGGERTLEMRAVSRSSQWLLAVPVPRANKQICCVLSNAALGEMELNNASCVLRPASLFEAQLQCDTPRAIVAGGGVGTEVEGSKEWWLCFKVTQ